MKELELELQKLKEAIDLKDPYLQISAIGNLTLEIYNICDDLGLDFDKCFTSAYQD